MKLIRCLCSGQLHNNIPAILADEVLVGPDVVVDAVVVLVELVLEVLTSWVFQELLRHKASSPRLKREKNGIAMLETTTSLTLQFTQ